MEEIPYIPPFRAVEQIIEILREHGGAMQFSQLKEKITFNIDCPFITVALAADARIKVCRKKNTIRFFPKMPLPAKQKNKQTWMDQFKRGVPNRCLDARGVALMKQKMGEGECVLIKDFAEEELVWFSYAPRVPSLPQSFANKIMAMNM